MKQLIIAVIASILFFACSNDDSSGAIVLDPQTVLEQERTATIGILTNGNNTGTNVTQPWRISYAILTNDSGTIDISNNFNVADDEFIFFSEGSLEWRPGNDINIEGENNNETLLDFYLSPETSEFIFNDESSTELTAINGRFTFTVVDEETITGILTFSGTSQAGGEIEINLTPKLPEDYILVPENGLVFTELTTIDFENTTIHGEATSGLVGSFSDNSLFVSVTFDDGNGRSERIIKYNPSSNTIQQHDFLQQQFLTKKAHIINNELVVVGGEFINTYDNLNANSDPIETIEHGLSEIGISRFPTSVVNNNVYVIGGDIGQPTNGNGDEVRVFNRATNTVDVVGTLPGPKIYSGSEIVNDKLYVFSGRQYFLQETAETTSYIFDLNTGSSTTFNTTQPLFQSYASKDQNLIYIAGETRAGDGNKGIYFGVYNTLDDTFTEIVHDLDDSDEFSSIHQMTVFNGKIYVIYGWYGDNTGNGTTNLSIMEADLN